MNYPWIDEYLLSLPGVTKDVQPDWNWIRYKLGDKMFAAMCRARGASPITSPSSWSQLRGTSGGSNIGTFCPATI